MDPAKFAGLAEGDAHVIRNAGGRASDDAIRSLIISHKLQGTREWFVIHHTNCGQEYFTDEMMNDLLASSLETATLAATGFTMSEGTRIDGRRVHRLAHDHRSTAQRGGGRATAPQPPVGPTQHRHLRVHLRREDRTIGGSAGSDGDRQTQLTKPHHHEPTRTNMVPRPSELSP